MERRLGKGLGSLLGGPAEALVNEVELGQIRPNPDQPRKSMDPVALEELRDSIRTHGVLQPVVLRRSEGGFELVSGERRWRAARLAGLERVPAVVRDVGDDEMLELALVENLQRRDLDPMERARGFRSMMDALHITQEAVAAKVGLKRATVANHLRLLDLPERVQEALARGLISMGHARALLGMGDVAAMTRLMEAVVREDLSVREVERAVRESSSSPRSAGKGGVEDGQEPWVNEIQRRLREALGTRVSLLNGPRFRGRIVIEYFSREELERLIERLAPRQSL